MIEGRDSTVLIVTLYYLRVGRFFFVKLPALLLKPNKNTNEMDPSCRYGTSTPTDRTRA